MCPQSEAVQAAILQQHLVGLTPQQQQEVLLRLALNGGDNTLGPGGQYALLAALGVQVQPQQAGGRAQGAGQGVVYGLGQGLGLSPHLVQQHFLLGQGVPVANAGAQPHQLRATLVQQPQQHSSPVNQLQQQLMKQQEKEADGIVQVLHFSFLTHTHVHIV